MHRKILLLALIVMILSGCTANYIVQVSAIAEPGIKAENVRYVLLNGNTEGGENDLFFREYSAYFIPVLAKKGYQRVATRDEADLEIFFRYTVSDGRSSVNTFSRPIYETVGGNTINIVRNTTNSSGETTTTNSTVRIPLQTVYVGTVIENQTYTLYTSNAALEAYQIKPEGKILWKTLMNITNESNDLRATMPIMAVAAAPYLAGNSGMAKSIQLKKDDPKIAAIRKKAGQ